MDHGTAMDHGIPVMVPLQRVYHPYVWQSSLHVHVSICEMAVSRLKFVCCQHSLKNDHSRLVSGIT